MFLSCFSGFHFANQDEDADGNVYVASITPGGRAEKSGMVFKGDIIVIKYLI